MPGNKELAQKAPTGGRFLPQGPLWRKRAGGVRRGQNGQNQPEAPVLPQSAKFQADPVPSVLGGGPQCLEAAESSASCVAAAAAKNSNLVASVSAAAIGLSSSLWHSNDSGMSDDQGKRDGQESAVAKDSREDRLKLALRENLKRRKSQASGRSDAGSAPSEDADAALDDASGKGPGR